MRLIKFRSHRKHRKSNPKRHHRRNGRRHRRHNPSLKALLSPSSLMSSVAVAGGFIIGNKVSKMAIGYLPVSIQKFGGALIFVLGAFAASKAKGDLAKKAAAGVAASGIYNLVANMMPSLVSGETISMNGVELVGNDSMYAGETISVSGDMTELVGDGDDDSRVYG